MSDLETRLNRAIGALHFRTSYFPISVPCGRVTLNKSTTKADSVTCRKCLRWIEANPKQAARVDPLLRGGE